MNERILHVTEIFRSIQGESTFAGLPCVFVRLSGCNLRCRYCDTDYAWPPGTPMQIAEILARVDELGPGLTEVTGGEPLMQAETPALLDALAATGRTVLLETNGTLRLPETRNYHVIMDIKCPSSGASEEFCRNNPGLLQAGDEVKFVIADRKDFDWALNEIQRYALASREIALLAAPVHGELAPTELASWILASNLPLRLQLQLHKIIWPESLRGV
jgi:7-carboxy-7-deazaguanine synthase